MVTKNSKFKIVLVEDKADIALRLQKMLTKMGFDVIGISYTGADALKKARHLKPDLILMDIMLLGKMHGIKVAKTVTSELNIPVILLMPFLEDKIIVRGKQAEPFGFILSPFQNSEIVSAIGNALHNKEMEEKLRKDSKAPDQIVKERTLELHNLHETLKRREVELAQHKRALERLNQELMDINKALSVVAEYKDVEKQELQKKFFMLCNGKIIPMLKKLQTDVYCRKRQADLELMINYLEESFRDSSQYQITGYNLSDQEMRVALMIKNGLSNQQIADMLYISLNTVKTHRRNIRKKLHIKNPSINLVSYLKSEFDSD